ncbi:MAG: GerMN domain-containing protein, partial [Acidobacteria bacterium]|nr:GerMN domain-containing protein [Acidobacteriota bacterium]
ARREVTQPPIATPTDVKVKARIFWASATAPGILEPVEIELPLSADPVQRSKQLINALIADAPSPEQHTLPGDTTLLEFYLLPDGTAVADFSDTLSTETPSGILNEQMAVDSVARTLAANVATVRRLKILIHGQEVETLAGHLDLTGFFTVRAEAPPAAPVAQPTPPGKAPASGLTPPGAPGKLGH